MSGPHYLAGLRAARKASKIDLTIVAERVGTTVNTYHRYEAGSRRIHFDKACVLADLFGVSLDQLRREPDDDIVVVERQLGEWNL